MNDEHWRALRKLLTGGVLREDECSRELAQAAVQGGVVRLAVEHDGRLEQWISSELERVIFQDLILERATGELGHALSELSDSILLLKGSASAHMLYQCPGHRERRDVDLLLLGESQSLAVGRLLESGWSRLPEQDRPWWSERKSGRYEETLFKDFGGHRVEADLHHRLSLYRHLGRTDEGLQDRSSRAQNIPFRLPSPEDLALHTALHAAATGFRVPLKSWFDLHLLGCDENFNWDALCARAVEWKIGAALWAGLTVASSLLNTPVPKETLTTLAPPTPAKRTLERMLSGQGETPIRSGRFVDARRQVAKSLALGGSRPWQLVLEQARIRLERPE